MAQLAVEAGLIESGALADPVRDPPPARFQVGDAVVVKRGGRFAVAKAALERPGYAFGAKGVVERVCGAFSDPETLAFSSARGAKQRTVFASSLRCGPRRRHRRRTPSTWKSTRAGWRRPRARSRHDHGSPVDEDVPARRLAESGSRTGERGVVTREELRKAVERLDAIGTQQEGPRLARAWVDEGFKRLLLRDATAAAGELGIAAVNSTAPTVLTAVENTSSVHNLIVCTLCSCYPLSILGLSPPWYKSRVFRARAVREPRRLLSQEFGLAIPDDVAVRVHDSTADLRYIVLPRRPAGTEGLPRSSRGTMILCGRV